MIGDVIYGRIILCVITSMLDFLMLILLHVFSSDIPITIVPDDLVDGLRCYARGTTRTHDGLMMLLTVGRNRALSLVVQFSAMFISVCCLLL